MGADFVHLHLHSEYSLLDGACRLEKVVAEAARQNMPALAITDHGVMYGVADFYRLARQHGVKPILGAEVYVARRSRFHRQGQQEESPFHLVLLARDYTGYQNLLRLVSRAYLEGFYYKPRVDRELLAEHREGLIALSACLAGEIPALFLKGREEEAAAAAAWYREVFGPENFYLELQDHDLAEQKRANRFLIELSRRLDLPLVATNDVHYLRREDAALHDVLLCIQTGKTLEDSKRLEFPTQEFYFKTPEEMAALFAEVPEALTSTLAVAERCEVELPFGRLHLPHYPVPEGHTAETFLRHLCEQGLKDRGLFHREDYRRRLEYELDVIFKMGFAGYFLVVWDLVHFAHQEGILTGPGRGSAAGSLVAYALGITQIDPLRYDLLFERFLNPERVTMPDIDIDFCFERRGEVLDYLTRRYGEDRVAQIITFGTMAARAAIRDVGRVLNVPLPEVDRLAKLVPAELGISLDRALEGSPELRQAYEADERVRQLVDYARALEGTPRHASTHAAGVVIAPEPLVNFLPLQKTPDGPVTTQFPMNVIEDLGLLKMDVLGLRTLTVIGDTLRLISRNGKQAPDMESLSLEDPKTYALLSSGESVGVFQLESSGMRTLLRSLRPERFEDLVALVALYRPGPLGSGMVEDFIRRKHRQVEVKYLHPALEPILRDTYGVILYQEQVMRIASELAGFSLGEADLLRRAMGKKKPEVLAAQRSRFLEGAAARGVARDTAVQIFDLMEYFAGYGFNRSHSAAYALVAYQTAYLKANYPVEFMAALLTSVRNHPDKVPVYIEECRRMGIEILPPDVNASQADFSVSGNAIRFGLAAVKNVGEGAIASILEARAEGPFASLADFCRRVDLHQVNKRVIESLIRCGAMDSLGVGRARLLAGLDACLEAAQRRQEDRLRGQLSLFDLGSPEEDLGPEVVLPEVEEFSPQDLLGMEKDMLGFYVSGHPLAEYRDRLALHVTCPIAELGQLEEGTAVVVGGMVAQVRRLTTKKNEVMASLLVEDTTGGVEVLVFPRLWSSAQELLGSGQVVVVEGRTDGTEEGVKILADRVRPLPAETKLKVVIRLEPDCDGRKLRALQAALLRHRGPNPVYLFFPGQAKYLRVAETFWVSASEELRRELEVIAGPGTVEWKA
ncbi:MAG: DNA polymerase III subunit alpha [Clostridia bacterium]|jgi:DNA polymerase-3 subunit alpha|nr:DNA polymerase III subunit alpha [Clostridia bacterium]MDH7573995.1 DNA polymerase III subunit alpha [Clostridia bacterium]